MAKPKPPRKGEAPNNNRSRWSDSSESKDDSDLAMCQRLAEGDNMHPSQLQASTKKSRWSESSESKDDSYLAMSRRLAERNNISTAPKNNRSRWSDSSESKDDSFLVMCQRLAKRNNMTRRPLKKAALRSPRESNGGEFVNGSFFGEIASPISASGSSHDIDSPFPISSDNTHLEWINSNNANSPFLEDLPPTLPAAPNIFRAQSFGIRRGVSGKFRCPVSINSRSRGTNSSVTGGEKTTKMPSNSEEGDVSSGQTIPATTWESSKLSSKYFVKHPRSPLRDIPGPQLSQQRTSRVQFSPRSDEEICAHFCGMDLTDKNEENPGVKQTYEAKSDKMNKVVLSLSRKEDTKVTNKVKKSQIEDDTTYTYSCASTSQEGINYDSMPQEPYQLDEHEKQVHASFKLWRFQRKNELEAESHNRRLACQDRSICELIRRRRNNVQFASYSHVGHKAAMMQLLSVWGIGPAKTAAGGVGWEMLDVLDSENNVRLLQLSRDDHHHSDPATPIIQRERADPQFTRSENVVVCKKSKAKNQTPRVPLYIAFGQHQSSNQILSNKFK